MEIIEAVLYESHMHTPLCKHAQGEPEAYAEVASQRGLRGIIVTCHNPPIDGWSPGVRMAEEQFDTYVQMVERARQAWDGRIDIRLGLECDFVPGMEEGLVRQLSRAQFNHVLGSVHPQINQYKERYYTGDVLAFQRTYFEHLALAAETGLFDTLAHPDLVKNEHPNEWQVERLADTIADSLDRIAAAGTAMELNTSGLQKKLPEMNPNPTMLAEMQKRGIPVVPMPMYRRALRQILFLRCNCSRKQASPTSTSSSTASGKRLRSMSPYAVYREWGRGLG